MILILDEQAANTDGSQDTFNWVPYNYNNGKGVVFAFGTFDGATITVEFSPDKGDNWFELDSVNTTFTALGWSNFEMQGIVWLRGTVADVGTTSVSLGIL